MNGPHQGAWVDTPAGEDWFLHFQDRGALGRVVHLQPMLWRDDGWPVMGDDPDRDGKGVPVLAHAKPRVTDDGVSLVPATSDEFDTPRLGLQWQWNANPRPGWASLTARPRYLRLSSVPAPAQRNDGSLSPGNLYDAPNFLLQKFPAEAFTATTAIEFAPLEPGEFAGLTVFGYNYAILGVRRTAAGLRLELVENIAAHQPGARERLAAQAELPEKPAALELRVEVDASARASFSYSIDGAAFVPLGEPFPCAGDRWIGAKLGLLATAPAGATRAGHADFAWFRVGLPRP